MSEQSPTPHLTVQHLLDAKRMLEGQWDRLPDWPRNAQGREKVLLYCWEADWLIGKGELTEDDIIRIPMTVVI
jgi:hypothetical protein